jgi:sulfur carrier protein
LKIILNGKSSDVRGGESVLAAIEQLGLPHDARGVAVAVDGEVIPRAQWEDVRLSEGARVEVLSAMQGG